MDVKEFRNLTVRAKSLLNAGEGFNIEYKKSLSDLSNEDIVAFANSDSGGTILVGVEEYKTSEGRQRGRIVGCPVGDKEKIGIVSRAENCIPPIKLDIIIENSNKHPFFRIEIQAGSDKPYCTPGGTYKTRGDGHNIPLSPSRLLSIFMENESHDFIQKFRATTRELEIRLEAVLYRLDEVHDSVEFVSSDIADARSVSDEATSTAEQVVEKADEISASSNALHEKLDVLLDHFKIENPDVARQKAEMEFWEKYFSNAEKGQKSTKKRKAG